ncbi:glycosyltransferase family 39 protein, partial [Escherichia coli]|nr:glycosyltransferase family 39 protein [Escherichia coli]
GFHWFEKPALLYWLQIVSYHLFGINEFAARFGPALFGLGTIAAIYVICRESENASGSSEKISFAELAALMAATSLG